LNFSAESALIRTPTARKLSPSTECPDIFELESGDFAVIGIDITAGAVPKLPPSAGCGPDERIVLIRLLRGCRSARRCVWELENYRRKRTLTLCSGTTPVRCCRAGS